MHAQATADGSLATAAYAASLDAKDGLARMRKEFIVPPTGEEARRRTPGSECVYLCGNSLGLQPRRTRAYVEEELDKWAQYGVEGHFRTKRPWVSIEDTVQGGLARLVGALPHEVVAMGTLTSNLHLLMAAFYKPSGSRGAIILESRAFPSDHYAVVSQLLFHGRDPATDMILLSPREGADTLDTADIAAAIAAAGDRLALVLFSGVQYYTGQFFDIPAIVAAGHAAGAMVGIDLAHAVGNTPLALHAWGVDFAVWCSYKYVNAGPGGLAGAFVHDRFADETLAERPFFAGWWGTQRAGRFKMGPDFEPQKGAARFQLSNPAVLTTAALHASLDAFDEAGGMEALRAKSLALTGYMEALLTHDAELAAAVRIITPTDTAARGCQLSLVFASPVKDVYTVLSREGVIVDIREPLVMRVAPVPMYNTFADVLAFVLALKAAIAEVAAAGAAPA